MGILNNPKIITGIKPAKKNRPDVLFDFDKSKPLGAYNFPTYSYARFKIKGHKRDAAGIKRPIEWEETLPMGKKINKKYPKGITIESCERIITGPRIA